jgi:hypothetical protein
MSMNRAIRCTAGSHIRFCTWFAVLTFVMPLMVCAQPTTLPIVISQEPQGIPQDLKYRVEATTLSVSFFVRNAGNKELADLRLLPRTNEVSGNQSKPGVRLTSVGQRLDDGTLKLAANEEVEVQLNVTGIPIGKSTGYLLLEQGSMKYTLAPLSFEYFLQPQVQFVGVADGAELQGTTQDGKFEQRFLVQSQNETPIAKLQAIATKLTAPDGVQRELKIRFEQSDATAVRLDSHAVTEVRLTADTPLVGTYKGSIILSYDGQTKDIKLSVSRTKVPLPYEILPIEAVRTNLLCSGRPTRIRVGLHELNGLSMKAPLPELVMLNSTVVGQKTHQVGFRKVAWRNDTDQLVTALDLGKGQTNLLWLEIFGISSAGEHSGSLRYSLPDSQVVTQNFSVVARHHCVWAIIIISVGVALSQFLKQLASRGLNIREQQQLARIDSNAARLLASAGLSDNGRTILERLRARVSIVFTDSQANRGQSYAAEITELDRKVRMVPDFASAWDRAALLDSPPPDDILRRVAEVRQYLLSEDSDSANFDTNKAKLEAVRTDIDVARRKELVTRIDLLNQQIDSYQSAPLASTQLQLKLENLKTSLTSAREQANQQVDTASDLYNSARRDVVSLLIEDLKDRIDIIPRAFANDEAPWQKIQVQLNKDLIEANQLASQNPDSGIRRYYRIRLNFTSEIVEGSIRVDTAKLQSAQDTSESDRRTLQNKIDGWKSLRDKLQTMRLAAEFKPEDLFAVEREIIELEKPPSVAILAAREGADAATVGSLLRSIALPKIFEVVIGMSQPDLADAKGLQRSRIWNELLLVCISGIVAVLLGLKLLWVDNLVWGGANDYLVALLWGLGLHQVANASFDFNTFISRLTTPAVRDGVARS